MKRIILTTILLMLSTSAFSAASFTKEGSYCPVSMSYNSLSELIEGIRTVAKPANASKPDYFMETISIESKSIKVDLKSGFTKEELLNGPSKGTSVRYRMSLEGNSDISDITLYLTDYSREITVTGSSRDHVNALLSLATSKIKEVGCGIGGAKYRSFGGMFIFISAFILSFLPIMGLKLSKRGTMILISMIILLYIFLWTPDWENILPGTLITIGEESFYDRNSSIIAVAGLVLGIISILVSIYFGFSNNKANNDQLENVDTDNEA